jgi:ATP/maltotriose-dependent transcriptional regulator MalT
MPAKKKTTKTKQKRATPRKKKAVQRKSKTANKGPKRKPTQKKASRSGASRSKRASVSSEREINQDIRRKNRIATGMAASRQSGDLQGLSRAQQADSESVDELVEEGNLFEAGAVAGVEEADNADEREVHTREMQEDDVPEEYLDDK